MTLPVQSVRALPEHRDILQRVADLLRQGHADTLRRLLADAGERPVGPFKSEAAALGFITGRLVTDLRPRMIWLFGSRARGGARPDSDFDILVVLPDGLPESAYAYTTVAAPLVASGLGYDVVPCPWSVFTDERARGWGLLAEVVRDGRLLYQDHELRREADERAAA